MSNYNASDIMELPDEAIDASDDRHLAAMRLGSERLRDAILEATGSLFPCGHVKTATNTQIVKGEYRCKRCRRTRWTRGFGKICERTRMQLANERRNRMQWEMEQRGKAYSEKQPKPMPAFNKHHPEFGFNVKRLVVDVCGFFHVSVPDFYSAKRNHILVDARRVVANILRDRGWSYPQIAGAINRVDHTTARNLVETFTPIIRARPYVGQAYARFGGDNAN